MEQLRRIPRRTSQSQTGTESGSGAQDNGAESGGGRVQVIWGPLLDELDVGGMSVGEVATLLRDPYHLAPGAVATVNGVEADSNTPLTHGDTLEFIRAAGEKGSR